MTIRHQQGKALHSTLNTVALIAITVYLWYAGPEKPANQPVAPLSTQSAPQPGPLRDFRKGVDGVSFGLMGMRQRAEQLEGKLVVDSTESEGTLVQLTIPTPIVLEPGHRSGGAERGKH